jgi:sec-independent protein translocase protein TatC
MTTFPFFRPSAGRSSPDDLFAATRMPLGDHLEELRRHLGRAVAGFGLAFLLVFLADGVGYVTGTPIGIAKPVKDAITLPVEQELQNFYDRRVRQVARDILEGKKAIQAVNKAREVQLELEVNDLARLLAGRWGIAIAPAARAGSNPEYVAVRVRIRPVDWAIALHEAERLVGKRPTLSTMSVTEGMVVYLKVALVCAFVLSSPWLFWQIWSFVAAGLYPHEKRPVYAYLPFSVGLFLAGVLVCQLLVMPRAVEALLWFNEWLDFEPDLRLNEWLGFAIFMPVLFGLSFQTPLVMLFLERVGILSVDAYQGKRRLAWFLLAVLAAVACPSADWVSMVFLWLPLCFLFELGIVLCRWAPRRQLRFDRDDGETGQRFEA